MSDDLWYKDAVFYELHVKAYADSNGDGMGDFPGLVTARLDHLKALGVDCVWLLPMYPSPFRDDGYDISDYCAVHPQYGTLDDFRAFLDAAHERGLRVITELVLNHTSDQHPWFKEARSSPDSPKRDYYVWSDTDDRYRGRADHLPRHRDVELGLGPRLEGLLLAPLLQPPARPQLRQPGGARGDLAGDAVLARDSGWTASGWTPCPTSWSGRARPARTCPRRTRSCASCGGGWTRSSPGGCSSPRPTCGRRTCGPTSGTATASTWPSTSRSCRGCSWPCGSRTGSPSSRSWSARRRSPPRASGASSSATTTS